ncbi:phage major capsid protein, HK97 family [Brevibacillus sp. CF112]|uniref:phage major capsid protein n=1 Tax=Brevibacillus TaxID=55080 RepID=UPI000271BB82|nr:phage major capsid protein [Brevibacillus sp. CF112]EJL44021.1 phage major capsid protein, HK97 family [Brevibacillus sp. CF112]
MLRQLLLGKKIEQRKNSLAELLVEEENIQTRSAELEAAAAEASTDEEIAAVEEEVTKLEAQKGELEEKKSKLQGEIEALEGELEQLNAKEPGGEQRSAADNQQKRGVESMNRLQVRELLKTGEYFRRSEVVEFYEKFRSLRAVSGGELTIPDVVINRIMDILGDFTTLYPLVEKIPVKGTARILIDTDTTPATWIEQSAALPAGDVGTITNIDFDGFKVGKVTFVDNYLLQDSIINLDAYVTRKIARAIAKALDQAILKGTGAANKQPTGIIPSIPAGNRASIEADANLLKNLVKQIGLIDTGDDSVGEIVAVMRRQTYYNRLAEFSIQVDASGNVVGKLPNLRQPDLVGLRVVFSQFMDADQVLFGDFSQYTLVERENITIDRSEHVKFTEDQMAFRGKGRFDGKPTKPAAFAVVTITDPAPEV